MAVLFLSLILRGKWTDKWASLS